MGIKIGNNKVFDDIMALPHLWPGEDFALVQTVIDDGGVFR